MGLYRVRVSGRYVIHEEWSFAIYWTSAGPLSSVVTAATTWVNNWWGTSAGTKYGDMVNTTSSVNTILVEEVDLVTGKVLSSAETMNGIAGRSASNPLPPGIGLFVDFRTARTGPGWHGGILLPAPTTAACASDGKVNGTQIQQAGDAVASGYAGAAAIGTPVLYRRQSSGTEPLTGLRMRSRFYWRNSRERSVYTNLTQWTL